MSDLLNISPVLPVQNMDAEIEFFEKLGFTPIYDSSQYSNHFDYSILRKDNQTIHLQLFEKGSFQGQQLKIWVSQIESLESELSKLDLSIGKNFDTPWNTHELGVYSPSKHAIIFVQEID